MSQLFFLFLKEILSSERICLAHLCPVTGYHLLSKLYPEFARIHEIDFTSPSIKHKKLLDGEQTACSSSSSSASSLKPTADQLDSLYRTLSSCSIKPVLLSITPDYADPYVPVEAQGVLPIPLRALYNKDYLLLSYTDLLAKCEGVSITVTTEQAHFLEEKTRLQAKSTVWFEQRAGRVTASKFKAACHTDSTQPSQSLIKSICYPENNSFKSKSTDWGCTHEKKALEAYCHENQTNHRQFDISCCGLIVNPTYPHMGATPDGIVTCECCGRGVLEIKCPFSCRDKSFAEAATTNSRFFLTENDGVFTLKRNHAYYYQIQLQMKLCETTFGDFIVWREGDLIVERIYIDDSFLVHALEKATTFFKLGILPEILGKWYTRLPEYQHEAQACAMDDVWCYCRSQLGGTMIACDNEHCSIIWFHMSCLHLKNTPRGKWYCPDCRRRPSKRN